MKTTVSCSVALLFVLAFASCAGSPPATATDREIMKVEAVYNLIDGGKLEEAEARLMELMEAKPLDRDLPVLLASVQLSMGKIDQARATVQAEVAAAPDNLNALFVLSEIERLGGDTKAQKAALDALLAADPANADAHAALGDLAYDGKNYAGAEAEYAKALAADETHVDALMGLARVMVRREDSKAALAYLTRAVDAEPDNAVALLDRSRVYRDLGRLAESEADLDKAVELAPSSAWTYLERGILYMDTGRAAKAETDLGMAIDLDPDYFLPYVYRAGIREELGKDQEALEDYRAIVKLNPDYWYALESIGVLSWRQGAWQDSADAFMAASTHSQYHPEYHIAAALALLRSGNARGAKDYAGKNLPKINKDTYPAHWLMLRLAYDQTDMSTELELRISAERSLDNKAAMLFYLGAYWMGRNHPELGAKYVRLSLELDRQGTLEHRMAQAELARLPAEK
ncbi:MAG: tetratricopeptide repeat protein [Spirochaetales bacterium]|nr:tetratricopeptide repeat protein [Spirochaetales bacterium]MBP7263614.1 tetratricopeptide repeat protein [Spirochaetia bacterium]